MSNVIRAIREDREELARVLAKHTGIRKIVEDLYPDSAHFIYELLQNAEDAGATKVQFRLTQSGLSFEHDGRPFTEDDVWAITDIGEGSKGTDEEKIGRFGIGFKAVFAYTEKPNIWSPTFSFSISQLVLPNELTPEKDLGEFTRFFFPFNNPKKSASVAFDEVRTGLNQLDERTLLFLTNIRAVLWQIGGQPEQSVLRDEHPDNHVEILKDRGGGSIESVHYLRFTHPVKGLESQDVAVAFRLEFISDVVVYDHNARLADQFRIVPARPPRVAVFFAAEKETSGLRFHLHAPFVPELSRASIKDTPANTPLFQQLADLAARSLFVIRDLGFLNTEFLGVLPNPNDAIPPRYENIRTAVVTAMREQALTPTNSGKHLPARQLLQSKASLKTLLTAEDLEYLVHDANSAPAWAVGAAQRNSDIDRFLGSLKIRQWGFDKLLEYFQERLSGGRWFDRRHERWVAGTDVNCLIWLGKKSEQWYQQLYSLLYHEIDNRFRLASLSHLQFVRLSNGDCGRGAESYFPTAEVQEDNNLPRVAIRTYTLGKSVTEKESARKFLEAIGVREVGEYEQVEAILERRYKHIDDVSDKPVLENKVIESDLRRFIALAESEPASKDLFTWYEIFECEEGTWVLSEQVYIDSPYRETGLSSFYAAMGDDAEKFLLSERYLDIGVSRQKLVNFAESIGAKSKVEIEQVSCYSNPNWSYLASAPGKTFTRYGVNSDYVIPGLKAALAAPTVDSSRLVWAAVQSQTNDGECLKAHYQKNSSNLPHYSDSQLVHILRDAKWVPQADGSFVIPKDASIEELPEGFAFDAKAEWVSAVQFGENAEQQATQESEKQEIARELGFEDTTILEDAKWFAGLSSDERKQFKLEYESRRISELPTSKPKNPGHRRGRVAEEAGFAPEKASEMRTRSVSIGREAVKQETDPYLRQQYTNHDDEMICQICQSKLPFRLADGSYFFFAVEFLSDLKKHYYQNYLALCPLHGAMYRWANASKLELTDLFSNLVDGRMSVSLAGQDETIYFTQTHANDLQVALESDKPKLTT